MWSYVPFSLFRGIRCHYVTRNSFGASCKKEDLFFSRTHHFFVRDRRDPSTQGSHPLFWAASALTLTSLLYRSSRHISVEHNKQSVEHNKQPTNVDWLGIADILLPSLEGSYKWLALYPLSIDDPHIWRGDGVWTRIRNLVGMVMRYVRRRKGGTRTTCGVDWRQNWKLDRPASLPSVWIRYEPMMRTSNDRESLR